MVIPFRLGVRLILPVVAMGLAGFSTQPSNARVARVIARSGSDLDTLLKIPVWLVALPSGGVVVLDVRTPSAIVLDSMARVKGLLGRQGKGPGEWLDASAIGAFGDSVWISDGNLRRVTLFGPTGAHVKTIASAGLGYGVLFADHTVASLPPIIVGPSVSRINPVRIDTTGKTLNTIVDVPYEEAVVYTDGMNSPPSGMQPLPDHVLFGACPDGSGIILVDRKVQEKDPAFTVTKYAPDGRIIFRSRIPYDPKPIPNGYLDSIAEAYGAMRRGNAGMVATYRKALHKPAHLPSVSALAFGTDGTLLLARERAGRTSVRWTVMSAAGKVLYDVDLPLAAWVKGAVGKNIWTIERSPEGEAQIVRYRIE
jgi:hypothetical protein